MIRITLKEALEAREMTRYELAKMTGIQYQIIDKYYKDRVIRYDSFVLDRICSALNCEIGELLRYTEQ